MKEEEKLIKVKLYGANKYIEKDLNRRGEYIICKTCNKEFYVSPCYIRRALFNGVNLSYCSMKCYDKLGENNPFYNKTFSKESLEKLVTHPNRPKFKKGKENYNHVRFDENYVGYGYHWWRKFLLKEIARCEMCGYLDKRALQVHHTDKDRSNNDRDNLILLCANCHSIEHYKDRSGIYSNLKKDTHEREEF